MKSIGGFDSLMLCKGLRVKTKGSKVPKQQGCMVEGSKDVGRVAEYLETS